MNKYINVTLAHTNSSVSLWDVALNFIFTLFREHNSDSDVRHNLEFGSPRPPVRRLKEVAVPINLHLLKILNSYGCRR